MFDWICPVCGKSNQGETPTHDVCLTCEWEDDPLQRKDPNYWGGANDLSLNDYKTEWQKSNAQSPVYQPIYAAHAV